MGKNSQPQKTLQRIKVFVYWVLVANKKIKKSNRCFCGIFYDKELKQHKCMNSLEC